MSVEQYKVADIVPEVEWSDVKRSRHTRREALRRTFETVQQGWSQVGYVNYVFERAYRELHPECHQRAYTEYNDNSRPTSIRQKDWYKSPIEGVTPGQILTLAQMRFFTDPEERFRQPYELKRVLQCSADEIVTELMMFELGAV